jgi:segregation and condensation protein A
MPPKASVPSSNTLENIKIWEEDAPYLTQDREPQDTEQTEQLVLDLEGFEGPLDVLLDLARKQKVDLAKISILALVDQYLDFIDKVRTRHLELATDYLVMAAWLAYLKSRLLLPASPKFSEPSGTDLASTLTLRLRRLEQIRLASAALFERPRLGQDVFLCGTVANSGGKEDASQKQPQASAPITYTASIHDLLSAYTTQRQKQARTRVDLTPRTVFEPHQARMLLLQLMRNPAQDWMPLENLLFSSAATGELSAFLKEKKGVSSIKSSSLSALLELVREGFMTVQQDTTFAPIWVKNKLKAEVSYHD